MKNSLSHYEWWLVAIISTTLLTLGAFSYYAGRKGPNIKANRSLFYPEQRQISVEVQGAIRQPGRYVVRYGTTLGELMTQLELSPQADLAKLSFPKKLHDGQTLIVPFLGLVTLNLSGEVVRPGQYFVPAGTRICDLSELGLLSPTACRKFCKRKRLLKEGETLEIPPK